MKPNFVQYLLVNISELQIPGVKYTNIHCRDFNMKVYYFEKATP